MEPCLPTLRNDGFLELKELLRTFLEFTALPLNLVGLLVGSCIDGLLIKPYPPKLLMLLLPYGLREWNKNP